MKTPLDILKIIIAVTLYYSGLHKIIRWLRNMLDREKKITILLYHSIYSNKGTKNFGVSEENFERHMKYLSENYTLISLEKAIDLLREKKITKHSVVVTFDDGFKDNLVLGLPILKKYNIPTIIFLSTALIRPLKPYCQTKLSIGIALATFQQLSRVVLLIENSFDENKKIWLRDKLKNHDKDEILTIIMNHLDEIEDAASRLLFNLIMKELHTENVFRLSNSDMLSWEEIKEMYDMGITFGSHSQTHPILSAIPLEIAEREIYGSKKDIEERLHTKVSSFAYPNGMPEDYTEDHRKLLEKYGYFGAVTASYGFNTTRSDIYQLKRIAIDDIPMYKFAIKIDRIISSF